MLRIGITLKLCRAIVNLILFLGATWRNHWVSHSRTKTTFQIVKISVRKLWWSYRARSFTWEEGCFCLGGDKCFQYFHIFIFLKYTLKKLEKNSNSFPKIIFKVIQIFLFSISRKKNQNFNIFSSYSCLKRSYCVPLLTISEKRFCEHVTGYRIITKLVRIVLPFVRPFSLGTFAVIVLCVHQWEWNCILKTKMVRGALWRHCIEIDDQKIFDKTQNDWMPLSKTGLC